MKKIAFLIKTDDKGIEMMFPIDHDPFIIGRGTSAHLIIPSSNVSREHALIRGAKLGYVLEDLESHNGTFVNGQRIGKDSRQLKENDQIVIAGEASFVFHDPDSTTDGTPVGRVKGVWIDESSRNVWVDRKQIEPSLTVQQFTLLKLLYSEPGRAFSREEIIGAVWPGVDPSGVGEEAVDSVIKRLRARLRENSESQDYLQVIRGYGIKLVHPD